jgi:anti-anti-sigma factor
MVDDGLSVEVMEHNGIVLVALSGELTAVEVPTMLEAVDAALAGAPRNLQLGLAGVTFMDSGGAQGLLLARAKAAGARVSLQLLGPSRPVRVVLEVTKLDGVFEVVE